MKKYIVIDSGNVQHKGIFAQLRDEKTYAPYLYMSMICGYLKKIGIDKETEVIIAIDFGSWRKDEDKQYKAQRKEFRESKATPDWWKARYEEFNKLYIQLDGCLPWHFMKLYKLESDDWASVACRVYADAEIVLVSSDRDWEQLCYFPNVKIFSPMSKKYKVISPDDATKCLLSKIQGDISDNLLERPTNEKEFNQRKLIVDLINPLPAHIENPATEMLTFLPEKELILEQIPFRTIRERIGVLYGTSN
jgi:5'-3' exonuclease